MSGAECVPNIGPAQRRRRLRGGVVGLAVAIVLLAALLLTGADRSWRLLLFLPLLGAALGFFQHREKT